MTAGRPRRTTFRQQLAELLGYLEQTLPDDHPFARLARLCPAVPELPSVWLLGSSPQSAIWAGQLGLPYAFADFINPGGAEIAAHYREGFEPSPPADGPVHGGGRLGPVRALGRGGSAPGQLQPHDHDNAATRAADPGPAAGEGDGVPAPGGSLDGRPDERGGGRRGIIGSPETVRAGLEEVQAQYGADEVIAVTITHDHQARKRSYELLADAMALDPRLLAAA